MIRKFLSTNKIFEEVNEYKSNSILVCEDITQEELVELTNVLNIELKDLTDVFDESEIPRIENQESAILLFLRIPMPNDSLLGTYTKTLAVAINNDYLALISSSDIPFNKNITNYKDSESKIKLLYKILQEVNISFTNNIKVLRSQVRHQKVQAEFIDNKDIIKLTEITEAFDQYYSSLVPIRNAIKELISGKHITLSEHEYDLFEDIINAFQQLEEICKVNLKSIQSLRDAYQIIFTNRLNAKIQFLTAFTIIMTVPTTVSSIYGMNVDLPFAQEAWAFAFVIFVSLLASGVVFLLFLLKKWI